MKTKFAATLISILIVTHSLSSAGAQAPSDKERAVGLPPAAQAELEKATRVMKMIYIQFSELREGISEENYGGPSTYSVYFDGNRFYQRRQTLLRIRGKVHAMEREKTFDGKVLHFGDPEQPTRNRATLGKYLADDATDPDRTKNLLGLPYLDAAGFYAPERISELDRFFSVEPMVLRYLRESDLTKIEQEGESLRITVRIKDPYLTAIREMDIEQQRNRLASGPNSRQFVAREIENYKRLQGMIPKRTVSFLLDPKRGYATTEREEWTAAGQRIVRIEAQDWRHYESQDIWLPGRCIAYYFTFPFALAEFSDQPVLTATHSLSGVEFGSKDLRFSLDYNKPGTLIVDRTTPEARSRADHQVTYLVPGGAADLLRGAKGALHEVNLGRVLLWFASINLLILGAFVIVQFARSNRTPGGKS